MTGRAAPPPAGPRPIESVQRVAQVMRLFIEMNHDQGLSVTETAKRLNVAKSTVSRLLATLASEGVVMVDPETRRYHVGVLAFQVGSKLKAVRMASAVRPLVHGLAESTGHTAQIGTLHHTKVLYLVVAESETRLRVVAAPGDLRDAHTSAMGKAILAGLPDAELDDLIRALAGRDGTLPRTGPATITDPEVLRKELKRTASRGYSISRGEGATGVSAIGVCVPGPLPISLAVSIAFPSGVDLDEDGEALVEEVRAAAHRIAALLVPGRSTRREDENG
ncbi:MAG: IclR family transcriptional regulator [Acidimicrobiia bacterium]